MVWRNRSNIFCESAHNWCVLRNLHRLLQDEFASAPVLSPKGSFGRRSDALRALIAGQLSFPLASELDRLHRDLEPFVRHAGAALVPHGLSMTCDLTSDCVLTVARRCGAWYRKWARRGRSRDVEWTAYLLGQKGQALRTMAARRCSKKLVSDFASIEGHAWEFADRRYDLDAAVESERIASRARSLVLRLPDLQQRCVRLGYGMFPALRPWSDGRIGRALGLAPRDVARAREAGCRTVQRFLNDWDVPGGEDGHCGYYWPA